MVDIVMNGANAERPRMKQYQVGTSRRMPVRRFKKKNILIVGRLNQTVRTIVI